MKIPEKNIEFLCPTCGGNQFEYDESINEVNREYKCGECGLVLLHDQLFEENSEVINEAIKEMGKDVEKELSKELKKAFKGNKYISFK